MPIPLAGLVSRLPQWPPSTVLCAGINLLFLPTLDADTLFFSRRLSIDGDTELGLLVKNALDAIDWTRLHGPLAPVIERLRWLAKSRGRRDRPQP